MHLNLFEFVFWQARRCTQDIVLAERNLLTEALRDALNQRFILLSESCLPLYPPQTLYMQLMSEQKSRLESCPREVTYSHPPCHNVHGRAFSAM